MEEFDINGIKLLLLTFLILTLSSGIGAAAEIPVSPGSSIQAAVNSANPGDTVIVHPGIYNENIVITRPGFVLMSASGNPDDTIIASNDATKDVISVTSRNIVIKGFTISGAATDKSGIYLLSSRDCVIENNKFVNDALGVYVRTSVNTTIRGNSATRTGEAGKIGRGISVEGSEITTVLSNTISNHNYSIYFSNSPGNTVSGNSASQCAEDGIVIDRSNKTILESNTVSSNAKKGIYLKNSHGSSVKNNVVSSNGANGIDMELSNGTRVLDNNITGNARNTNIHGLFLNTCKDVYLQNNEISNCQYGVAMRFSENNSFVNNNAHDNAIGYYVSYTSTRNTLSGNKANVNNNGIIIERRANNNIVDRNEVNSNSASGIALDNAINNRISNNSASSNNRGIYLLSLSTGNTVSDNTVNSNKNDSVVLENTTDNRLTGNSIISSSSSRYGIYLQNSNNSYLINNTVQYGLRGINLERSAYNEIFENLVTGCKEFGIFCTVSANNNLSKNTAQDSGQGIALDSSENNIISSNKVSLNGYGIYMCPRSYGNRVYDNYFYNVNNANIRNNQSFWNTTKTPGKNIMGGPTLGGNFWGTPAGMGFSDTNSDADGDGIIDIPFVSLNGNITDNYPLIRVVLPVANFDIRPTRGFVPLTVEFKDYSQDASSISWDINGDGRSDNSSSSFTYVYGVPGVYPVTLTASNKNGTDSKTVQIIAEEFKVYPVAGFSASIKSGNAPLTVQFTDLSQSATSRNWDIGSDGTVESTNASFVYTFTATGTYPVTLTAINANGTSTMVDQIIVNSVTYDNDDNGGHSSGGGGGGGGSPEPAKNVQVKEISQTRVTNGKPVMFNFAKNATCVVYVGFDAKKSAGKTTTIAEQLKAKSTLVSNLSTGEVYKYFNLWVGNAGFATEKNIENPVVCFKVEKSWLQDKNIDKASITLNRYSDKKWSQLPVEPLREDNKYLYFTAETPGFSFFAITGKAVEKESVTETKPATETSETEQESTNQSETEQEQKPEQEAGKDNVSSIPGFGMICGITGLLLVFLYRRK